MPLQPKTIGETSATCNLLSSNVYILNKLNMRSACLRSAFSRCAFLRSLLIPKPLHNNTLNNNNIFYLNWVAFKANLAYGVV